MMTRGWDRQEVTSHGAALVLITVLAMAWFVAPTASWRDRSLPPAATTEPSIEVALAQEPAPNPAVPTEHAAAAPATVAPAPAAAALPEEHVRRPSMHRSVPAAAAPAELPLQAARDPAPEDGAVVVPAGAPAGNMPPSAARPDLDAQYAAGLRADIDRRTRPPDSAQYRLRRPSGEVRVGFVLIRSGQLKNVRVLHSSGSTLLDEAAVTIVATGHYPPMSADLFGGEAEHMFSVAIEFRQTG